jgi:hypothetical protein
MTSRLKCPNASPRYADNIFLIETIEALKDNYEEETGIRPSTDAVVTEMLLAKDQNPLIARMKNSRLMRIYAGRKELWEKSLRSRDETGQSLGIMVRATQAAQSLPAYSHVRLFWEVLRNRASKS